MSAFWAILWAIIKWAAIIGGSFALVVLLIAVFHPLYFSIHGRASVKGQRGEVRFSYLFNIIRIRYIATVHTQDVWLEIFKWRKLLQRDTVRKVSKPATYEPSVVDEQKVSEEESETKNEIKGQVPDENLPASVEDSHDNEEQNEASETTEEAVSNEEVVSNDEVAANDEASESKQEESVTEKEVASETDEAESDAEVQNEEPEYKVEATPEQLAELQNILEAEEKKEEAKKSGNDWNNKLRKFKKDFNRRYDQLSGKIRLVRQKWNSLWPVVKRFWNRGKKGFKFHDASLKIKYSLDEHHLTGMMCGYLAPTVGFAKQYGVNWEPVPIFPDKPGASIHSRASWHIDIRPYMLIWAVICLLFEKNLYKEIYWLYQFKKAKKAKKSKEKSEKADNN